MTYYLHVLPGKIRIRTSVLQQNEVGAFSVNKCLNSITGVFLVEISTLTGSILVHYEPNRVSSQTILSKLAQDGFVTEINWTSTGLRTDPSAIARKQIFFRRKKKV